MNSRLQLLPDPWFPGIALDLGSVGQIQGSIGTAGWAVANRAVYVPITFPCDATLYALYARGGDTDGNYDLGLYNPDGRLMGSKGSTVNANARLTWSIPDFRVEAGYTYHAAFVWSSTASLVYRHPLATARSSEMLRMLMETSAFPLPSVMTGVQDTGLQMPLFSFGVR